jgi:hypothetical protein
VGAATSARRELDYFIVDRSEVLWQRDVAPVFEQFCAGARCHGPRPGGAQVDLSSYEAWRLRASRIRGRLIRGEMPPLEPRPPRQTIDLVIAWIEGGMQP